MPYLPPIIRDRDDLIGAEVGEAIIGGEVRVISVEVEILIIGISICNMWINNTLGQHSRENEETVYEANILLMSYNTSNKTLLEQSLGSAILDSGCSRSVCGLTWYKCYCDTLPEELRRIKLQDSNATSRFGNYELSSPYLK